MALVAAVASLPGFFLLGMVSGEFTKSMVNSRIIDFDPTSSMAAARTDQMKLDLTPEARIAICDPRNLRIELARGWDVEQNAFTDTTALLYFSGPFFEEHKGEHYNANAIGDMYFDDHLQVASDISRGFADRRYYMAKRRSGEIEFGYGGWRPGYEERYEAFVGGLGYVIDAQGSPAQDYMDPYNGFKQELHNAIPRERLIIGRDSEGHLLVMKTLPLPQATITWFVRSHGFVEAYYLDQGNKARFIVPGRVEDQPRYNMPYMLRISDISSPPLAYSPAPLDDYTLHHKKPRRQAPIAASASEGVPSDPAATPGTDATAIPEPGTEPTADPASDPNGDANSDPNAQPTPTEDPALPQLPQN